MNEKWFLSFNRKDAGNTKFRKTFRFANLSFVTSGFVIQNIFNRHSSRLEKT